MTLEDIALCQSEESSLPYLDGPWVSWWAGPLNLTDGQLGLRVGPSECCD